MAAAARPGIVARLVTRAQAEADPTWGMHVPTTAEERLAEVVNLSRQLLKLAGYDDEQLRLRGSVCRVERRRS